MKRPRRRTQVPPADVWQRVYDRSDEEERARYEFSDDFEIDIENAEQVISDEEQDDLTAMGRPSTATHAYHGKIVYRQLPPTKVAGSTSDVEYVPDPDRDVATLIVEF